MVGSKKLGVCNWGMGWSEEEGVTGRRIKDYGPSDPARFAGRSHEKVSTIGHSRGWLRPVTEGAGRNWF
jgi:hypothetical protein